MHSATHFTARRSRSEVDRPARRAGPLLMVAVWMAIACGSIWVIGAASKAVEYLSTHI